MSYREEFEACQRWVNDPENPETQKAFFGVTAQECEERVAGAYSKMPKRVTANLAPGSRLPPSSHKPPASEGPAAISPGYGNPR